MLHDKPIAALSNSMQTYVDYTFQFTLLKLQQDLFPLWRIPISIDKKLVSKNMASLIEMSTTEKKISDQRSLTENQTSSSTRLTGRDEDDELKQPQMPYPKTFRGFGGKQRGGGNEAGSPQVEFAQSPIEEQESQPRKVRKEVAPRLDSDDRDAKASSQKSAHPPQPKQNQPRRPLSSKRKRSRSRRRRSRGK